MKRITLGLLPLAFLCMAADGGGCSSSNSKAGTDASAGTPDASLPACSWPAIYDATDASTVGATGQCVAARVLLSCTGSNGGGEECASDNLTQCPGPNATPGVTYANCQDQCQEDEYVLFCGTIGPPPEDASPTAASNPPANCRMGAANPSGREPYCCPCGP